MMRIYDADYWHIPFAISRVWIFARRRGVKRYHIFGVLVAEVQETKPWAPSEVEL